MGILMRGLYTRCEFASEEGVGLCPAWLKFPLDAGRTPPAPQTWPAGHTWPACHTRSPRPGQREANRPERKRARHTRPPRRTRPLATQATAPKRSPHAKNGESHNHGAPDRHGVLTPQATSPMAHNPRATHGLSAAVAPLIQYGRPATPGSPATGDQRRMANQPRMTTSQARPTTDTNGPGQPGMAHGPHAGHNPHAGLASHTSTLPATHGPCQPHMALETQTTHDPHTAHEPHAGNLPHGPPPQRHTRTWPS